MPGENDIIARMGLDLTNLEKGISRLESDMAKLKKESENTGKGVEKLGKQTEEAGKKSQKASKLFKAFLSALSGSLIIRAIKSVVDFGSEIKTASDQAGLSFENYQKLEGVFKGKLKVDDAKGAISSFAKSLRDARNQSPGAIKNLNELGLSFDDIVNLDADQAFFKVADAMGNVGSEGEKARRLTAIFGEEIALKLLPVLAQGGDALQGMADKTKVLGDSTVESMSAASKALDQFGKDAKLVTGVIAGLYLKATETMGRLSGGGPLLDAPIIRTDAPAAPDPTPDAPDPMAGLKDAVTLQNDYNDALARADETLASQADILIAQSAKLKGLLAIEKARGLENGAVAKELEAQIQAQELLQSEMAFQLQQQTIAMEGQTESMGLQVRGSKTLSDLAANRLNYERQIAEAQRKGLGNMVEQLQKQQALSKLQILANRVRMTPQQKRDERIEARAQQRAIRVAAARQKSRDENRRRNNLPPEDTIPGAPKTSASTQKAIDEFEAREIAKGGANKMPDVSAGGISSGTDQGDRARMKQIEEMRMKTVYMENVILPNK